MKQSTVVVDYKAGNLRSVENALAHLQAAFVVSGDPDLVRRADRVIFPGVGDASAAMGVLRETGLDDAIRAFYATGRPLLGICLGSQIVMDRSDEGDVRCLGLVPGAAVRFPNFSELKVPHMGWNSVQHGNRHPIFDGVPEGSSFYFVHSYFPKPSDPSNMACVTEYGIGFASAVSRDNLVATQFHPEKSGKTGLMLLSNFIRWNP